MKVHSLYSGVTIDGDKDTALQNKKEHDVIQSYKYKYNQFTLLNYFKKKS